MNTLRDESDDPEVHESRNAGDHEITLGTTMILLIFFALAVYGAVLFGFGYSLGSKHSAAASSTTLVEGTTPARSSIGAFKPAAGSPAGSSSTEKPAASTDETDAIPPSPAKTETPAPKTIAQVSDFEAPAPKAKPAPPESKPAATDADATPIPGQGTVVVQVAAVSHQEDADLIATTLKRRGYVVNIRTEADKLFHVQVGPFTTRKDAETMKAKLLADGFNAYIK